MEQSKIDRINFLAKKAKAEGLTDEEKSEQQQLRSEYVAAFRSSLINQLENTYIQYPDGRKIKVHRKQEPNS